MFRAHDPRLKRPVVLKLLQLDDERSRRRLQREAKAMAQLRHPNVVPLLSAGEHEGQPYLVLPLVEGRSLQDRLEREGQLPLEDALEIATQLGSGLQAVHALGLIHRDLKPANVLLGDGGLYLLTDFGLVKSVGENRAETLSLSVVGAFLGTPGYWPPEQARGELDAIGPAADVYGLAAIVYAVLSGHAPREASSLLEVYEGFKRPVPALRSVRPDAPAWLEGLLQACFADDPAARPALDAMLEALHSASAPARSPLPAVWALVALAVVVLTLASVSWLLVRPQRESESPGSPAPVTTARPADEPGGPPVAVREAPSAELRRAARDYRTVSAARSALKLERPRDVALLHAVHVRNARRPLLVDQHSPLLRQRNEGGDLVPPRSLFVPETGLLTVGGARLGRVLRPPPASLWRLQDSATLERVMNTERNGVQQFNACLPLPSKPQSTIMLEGLRRHTVFHGGSMLGFDGTEYTLAQYALVLSAIPGWDLQHDKPVSYAAARADDRQFALATTNSGSLLPGQSVVLRVPFPLRVPKSADYTLPRASFQVFDDRLRGLAYGQDDTLWIVSDTKLRRWHEEGAATRVATVVAARSLIVERAGRPLVGGVGSLDRFDPQGKLLEQTPLADFLSVDGLALLGADHVLAVGPSLHEGGAWAVLRLNELAPPRLVASGSGDFAYASVSVSTEASRACFMRWDGEFEIWDLDALLPWEEPAPQPR